jgi:hypothetical protein
MRPLAALRQGGQHLKPAREVADGFEVGRTLQCPFPCPLPVAHRQRTQACFGVVIRQQFRLRGDRLSKLPLQHLGNTLVIVLSRTLEE